MSDAPTCNDYVREIRKQLGPAKITFAANADAILTGEPYVRDTHDYEAEHIAGLSPLWKAARANYLGVE